MLQRHHEKLAVFSFPVEELQTRNKFTLGFDLALDEEDDNQELLEVTFIFEGLDVLHENEYGTDIRYLYLKSDIFTFSLADILEHPEAPMNTRELFNNPEELAKLNELITPYLNAIFEGKLALNDMTKQDMFETMSVEFDIELEQEEIVAPLYIQVFEG